MSLSNLNKLCRNAFHSGDTSSDQGAVNQAWKLTRCGPTLASLGRLRS